jgi:type II secretory pathway component PulC
MSKSTNPNSNGTPVNKSDAVRQELAKNPQAGSKAITAALAERGSRWPRP